MLCLREKKAEDVAIFGKYHPPYCLVFQFFKICILISVADPWHFGVDPDLDPRIHASD